MLNTIALWSGTLANIPANWNLCDGSGTTPNLIAKFLKGAAASVEPGSTGGSDTHTHSSMTSAGSHTHTASSLSHSHTVVSSGTHEHGDVLELAGGVVTDVHGGTAGAHAHTTNSASHSHTMSTDGSHTHAISTDDGRPPYYELAYIQAASGASVDTGIIIMWTGTLANIPSGWDLCDGGGSRPDLREKFIRGVNTNSTDPGGTGGSTTHNHTETAASAHNHTENNSGTHYHTFNAYTWSHVHIKTVVPDVDTLRSYNTYSGSHTHSDSNATGDHNHNALGNSSTHDNAHTVNTASSLPEYYDVAYIYNSSSSSIPVGGILVWTGALVNIPEPFGLCDGTGETPDLRGKFVRGSASSVDPGGTGGSATHTHTDENIASHNDHTETSAGAHQHSATNSIGAHTHSTGTIEGKDSTTPPGGDDNSAGAHSHTYNNEDAHSNHSITSAGEHNHNPWSTDNGEPAYYEVAFIQMLATYHLTGVTYDKNGDILGSCDCFLCTDNGDDTYTFLSHQVSNATTGVYDFTGLASGSAKYMVISWKDDTPHVFDVTDHVLQPVEET